MTFGELAAQKRLVVPSQVAREFAENRPEKLKTLYQQVSRKRSVVAPEVQPTHSWESSTLYKKLQAAEKELSDRVLEYRKALTSVLRDLESWHWDDPVSTLYREIIGPDVVVRLDHDEATTSLEWQKRIVHRLPPGYKDKGKPDAGIGDFLVWLTILQIGRERKKDAIFVSGDEKSDWCTKARTQLSTRALNCLKSIGVRPTAALSTSFGSPNCLNCSAQVLQSFVR